MQVRNDAVYLTLRNNLLRAFDTIGLTSRDLNSMGLVARHLLDVTKLQKVPLEKAPAHFFLR